MDFRDRRTKLLHGCCNLNRLLQRSSFNLVSYSNTGGGVSRAKIISIINTNLFKNMMHNNKYQLHISQLILWKSSVLLCTIKIYCDFFVLKLHEQL